MQRDGVKAGSGLTQFKNLSVFTENEADFQSGQQAMMFATEVLRRRRFPKIGNAYSGMQLIEVHKSFTDDERYTLALSVYQCLERLDTKDKNILKLHFWGDYADEQKLNTALALQERWRREGKRVRLSYMYSQRQLAGILGIGKSTAARHLDKAMRLLEKELQAVQLMS